MIVGQNEYKEALKYREIISDAAGFYLFEPANIAGIVSRESRFGLVLLPVGPNGTGDSGHGRGLMQIDDRWHKDFIATANWADARVNIFEGCRILDEYREFLKNKINSATPIVSAYLAAYNCGPGNVLRAMKGGHPIDAYTTGHNYSEDVLNRAQFFIDKGWD